MKTEFPNRRARAWRGAGVVACAILPIAGVAGLAMSLPQPAFLWNATPSEPIGLYVRSRAKPETGTVIAFRAPAGAFPYADARMGYLRRIPILKAVAAGEGDRVCTAGGVLTINNLWRGPVQSFDSRGVALPAWRGCRALAPGEFFVFSAAVPNSFDSRYYGPVKRGAIVGVYRPLIVDAHATRRA